MTARMQLTAPSLCTKINLLVHNKVNWKFQDAKCDETWVRWSVPIKTFQIKLQKDYPEISDLEKFQKNALK